MEIENSGVVEETEQVETEQEVAAPETTDSEPGVQDAGVADQPEAEKIPDKVWGIARKKAEAEAQKRFDAEIARRDAEFAQRFGKFTNPVTNQPITSQAEYFAALDAQRQKKLSEELQQKGIDPAVIDEAVKNNPLIKQAHMVVEEVKKADGDRRLNEQFAQVQKIDPRVTDWDELRKLDTFPEFDRLVRGGLDLVTAYKVANMDYLTEQKTKAVQQATINAAKGKEHLAPAAGSAMAATDLTEDDFATWASFGFTREQAIKIHNKNRKEGK